MPKISKLIEDHIEFHQKTYRVYANIDPSLASLDRKDALEFLGHAQLILSGQKSLGSVQIIRIYRRAFENFWDLYEVAEEKPCSQVLIGEAAPTLPIEVSRSVDGRCINLIFLDEIPREFQTSWIRLNIEDRINLGGLHLCEADIKRAKISCQMMPQKPRNVYEVELLESVYKPNRAGYEIVIDKPQVLKLIIFNPQVFEQDDLISKIKIPTALAFERWQDLGQVYCDFFEASIHFIHQIKDRSLYLELFLPKSFLLYFPLEEYKSQFFPDTILFNMLQYHFNPFKDSIKSYICTEDTLQYSLNNLLEKRIVSVEKEEISPVKNLRYNKVSHQESGFQDFENKIEKLLSISDHFRTLQAMSIACSARDALWIKQKINEYYLSFRKPIPDIDPDYIFAIDAQFSQLTFSQISESNHNSKKLKFEVNSSSWLKSFLRELVNLKDFKFDYSWFQSRSKIDIGESLFNNIFNSLIKSGFIEYDSCNRRYLPTNKDIVLADGTKGESFRNFHKEVYEVSRDIIKYFEGEVSLGSKAICFMKISSLEDLLKKNHEFMSEVFAKASRTELAENIYQLNMQIYPLFSKLQRQT